MLRVKDKNVSTKKGEQVFSLRMPWGIQQLPACLIKVCSEKKGVWGRRREKSELRNIEVHSFHCNSFSLLREVIRNYPSSRMTRARTGSRRLRDRHASICGSAASSTTPSFASSRSILRLPGLASFLSGPGSDIQATLRRKL